LNAYAHQAVPFELLVEELNPKRDLSYSPMFQVAFGLQNLPTETLDLPGLVLNTMEAESNSAKFDITLFMVETRQNLVGSLEYNTDLFDRTTISRMIGHFTTLLEHLLVNPEQMVSQLRLLAPSEEHQLLVEWNDTAVAYPPDECLHELFERQAALTPRTAALISEDKQLTYEELNEQANQLAHYLERLGAGPEARVGILMERSVKMVVGLLGILKAGCTYVPLDPQLPRRRLAFILEDAGISLLLTQRELLEALPPHAAQVVCFDEEWERIVAESLRNPATAVQEAQVAYLIYTSGTTGQPKAVMVEHKNLVNTILTSKHRFAFGERDVMPSIAAFSFDISLFEVLTPLVAGGTVNLLSKSTVLDMGSFLKNLQRSTLVHTVPSLMRQFIDFARESELRESFVNIRKLFIGGDWVPVDLLAEMQAVFPHSEIHVLYGPTEGTIICTSYTLPRGDVPRKHLIGRPLDNVQLRLLDGHRNLVPIGVAGELYLGGSGVTRGYLNGDELTAEKYVLIDGQRYYRTGDLARYLTDGQIEFLGRTDQQVKVRGFRIELGEIEAALAEFADVSEAVVLASADESGEKRLNAYIVAEQDKFPTASELRDFLSQKIPDYMIPAGFVMLDALPLTANGKVDRRALLEMEGAKLVSGVPYLAPQTDLERDIARIWEEVLKIEQVGTRDNFFDVGGHSLLMVQVRHRLQQTFGREIAIIDLLRHPNIGAFAKYLDDQQPKIKPSFQRISDRAKRQKAAINQQRRMKREIRLNA
jgi:amino acid adenylation domain-containing protein